MLNLFLMGVTQLGFQCPLDCSNLVLKAKIPNLCFFCRYDRNPDGMVAAGFSSAQRSLPSADNLQRHAVVRCSLVLIAADPAAPRR